MTANTCPICGDPMPGQWNEYPEFPFCTKRCRLVDLGRWLGEGYVVGGEARDRSTPGPDDGGGS